MRPQFAMAAIFFLVIGSSMLLLRARPGTSGMLPVRVTEHGSPGVDPSEAASEAAPRSSEQGRGLAAALAAETSDKVARAGAAASAVRGPVGDSPSEARAALAEARGARAAFGCEAAVPKLDAVGVRFAGTAVATDALFEEANCFKELGEHEKARELYLALLSTPYRERAQTQLDEASNPSNSQIAGRASARAMPKAALPAAAAPAKPATAPPAVNLKSGSPALGF